VHFHVRNLEATIEAGIDLLNNVIYEVFPVIEHLLKIQHSEKAMIFQSGQRQLFEKFIHSSFLLEIIL